MTRFFVLLGLVSAAAGGCAPALVSPTLDAVRFAAQRGQRTTLEQLALGRSLYVRRCTGCHAAHSPAEFAPERWGPMVDEMREQAHVTPSERDPIVAYLTAASARLHRPAIAAAATEPRPR